MIRLLTAVLGLIAVSGAYANEHIRDYDIDVAIQADGPVLDRKSVV